MEKFRLLGASEEAERHLTVEDLSEIEEFEGSEIVKSKDKDVYGNQPFFTLPNGHVFHGELLKIEHLKQLDNGK